MEEDYLTNFEQLGFDLKMLNHTPPGEWLIYQNYIFNHKGKIVKQFHYHIVSDSLLTNEAFDNNIALVIEDPTVDYEDRKYALMDFDGRLLTDFFDSFGEGWADGMYIEVSKNNKCAIMDKNGHLLTDFCFDWGSYDWEWLNITQNYIFLRVNQNKQERIGLFAFTGKVVLEPIYQSIQIYSQHQQFESTKQRRYALLNDFAIATDFDGNRFKWTHHQGIKSLDVTE